MTPVTLRASGSRGDLLIFVHGVGSTAAIWDAQLQAFSDSYRCVAVELRGNGVANPDPDPSTITRAGFAADVLAAADAAGCERFHFVGCSLGGVIGFEICSTAPQRLASLTAVGSFACYPEGEAYAQKVMADVGAAGTMEHFAHERAEKLGMPPGKRRDETIAQMAVKSVPSYLASTQATWTGDYRAVLGRIAVPALVMAGERDGVAPPRFAQEIAAGIPGARLEIVPDAGHVANADNPEGFNALLRAFLKGIV